MPASAAARMMLVPSGTVTSKPSMVNVTICFDFAAGVPKSRSGMMKSFILPFPFGGKLVGDDGVGVAVAHGVSVFQERDDLHVRLVKHRPSIWSNQ